MADWFNLYFKKSQVGCNAKKGWKNCHKFKSLSEKSIETVVDQVEELNLNNLVNTVLSDPTNELGSYTVNTTTQLIVQIAAINSTDPFDFQNLTNGMNETEKATFDEIVDAVNLVRLDVTSPK